MSGSMFNHKVTPAAPSAVPEEQVPADSDNQKIITLMQVEKENKPNKYVLLSEEGVILDVVDSFEELMAVLYQGFDESEPVPPGAVSL